MLCQACHRPALGFVCPTCRGGLITASDRIIPGGLRVIAAFEHSGPARILSHRLKYQGATEYAWLVAQSLAGRVPSGPLVPVPRATSRRVKYGIDPAVVLADAISRITGSPVLRLLRSPIHRPRRAGSDHSQGVGSFALRSTPPTGVVLVDDVVTTGATMLAAAISIGLERVAVAISANSRNQVSSHRVGGPITP